MNGFKEETGCEPYLYKDVQCCLHPVSNNECPEPICALDFPGEIRSYRKYKDLQKFLRSGMNLDEAAKALGISKGTAQSLFIKGAKVLVNASNRALQPGK